MKEKKQISIRAYIAAGTILLVLITAFVMFLVINILAEGASKAYIRSELSRELRRNVWSVSYEDGELKLLEDFQSVNDENMYFLILDRSGEILAGEYPEEIPPEEIPGVIARKEYLITEELLSPELGGREYYLLDRIHTYLTRKTGRTVIARCIVAKDLIPSPFKALWWIVYVSIALILVIACIFSYMIARMVSKPIGRLCEVAENIRRDNDLSLRMDYHGRFREIGILSEANNQMLDRLEKVFQSQKRFNSDVAHELRTPMAVVLAQCEAVRDHRCDGEQYREAVDVIYRQAQKTNDIVIQLLRLSRLEENKVLLEKEYVHLEDIVRSVCEEEELKAGGKAEFLFSFEDVSASVDVTLMAILIQNLVQNAVKYSDGKAVVEIDMRRADERIRISVRDHGRGISPEEQKHVFDPFYRTEKARSSGGFGLGLSIASRIAQLHGGELTVESEVGKGSCFELSLPDR